MSTRPATYHHGDLRSALLAAAMRSLNDRGEPNFSLSELSRALGVTPAAAYKHFADKDALIVEVTGLGFAQLQARFEAATPLAQRASSPRQATLRFDRLGEAYLGFGLQHPVLLHLIFGKGAAGYRQLHATDLGTSVSFQYLSQALEDLHHHGVIQARPNAEWQWFAWSAIHGATELCIAQVSNLVDRRRAARTVTRGIVAAMRQP